MKLIKYIFYLITILNISKFEKMLIRETTLKVKNELSLFLNVETKTVVKLIKIFFLKSIEFIIGFVSMKN